MGLSAQSTTVQKVDKTVSHRGQVCRASLDGTEMGLGEGERTGRGECGKGRRGVPRRPFPFLSRSRVPGYAPGHGPGVATSGSSSTFVSKRRNPRRS